MLLRRLRVGVLALPLLVVWLHACGNTGREPRNEPFEVAGSGGAFNQGGGAGTPASAGIGLQPWTCFEAGSKVAAPNGSVAIEHLEIGDTVLAFDERAGAAVPRRVQATFAHEVESSGRLALSDGRVLRVTGEHPIYDARQGAYVQADAFDGGETLVTLSQTLVPRARGSEATLDLSQSALALAHSAGNGFTSHDPGGRIQVFNISVEELENYFVEGVLVHNKTPPLMCNPIPRVWTGTECTQPTDCVRPEDTAHSAGGAGGEGGGTVAGAGAEAGSDSGGAGGANGDSEPTLTHSATIALCRDFSKNYGVLLEVDYAMPETTNGIPGFAVFTGVPGQICTGQHVGDVWLNDEAPPPPGSVTTHCVLVPGDSTVENLSVQSLHPEGRVGNLRAVTSCACGRNFRRQTTCGMEGMSTCGPVSIYQ
jgi:hypothetical protein